MNARQVKRGAERLNESLWLQLVARLSMIACTLAMPFVSIIMLRTYDAIRDLDRSQIRIMEQIASAERSRQDDRVDVNRRFAEFRDEDIRLWRAIRDSFGGR